MRDIKVETFGGSLDRMGAFFTTRDARYHVWFCPTTMQIVGTTLYKNALPDSAQKFTTRRLDATAASNAATIAALLKEVVDRKLVEDAIRRHTTGEAATRRAARVREAACRFWHAQMCGQPIDPPADIDAGAFAEISREMAKQFFPFLET